MHREFYLGDKMTSIVFPVLGGLAVLLSSVQNFGWFRWFGFFFLVIGLISGIKATKRTTKEKVSSISGILLCSFILLFSFIYSIRANGKKILIDVPYKWTVTDYDELFTTKNIDSLKDVATLKQTDFKTKTNGILELSDYNIRIKVTHTSEKGIQEYIKTHSGTGIIEIQIKKQVNNEKSTVMNFITKPIQYHNSNRGATQIRCEIPAEYYEESVLMSSWRFLSTSLRF